MDTMRYTRTEDRHATEHVPAGDGTVDPTPLAGTWLNTDKATRGIAKMILTNRGGVLLVHAYGACAPSLCDWGEVEGAAFSSSVSSSEGMAFTATYDFGFMETSLAVYLKGGILVLDSFNTFKDGSGRASYFSREFFHS